MAKSKRTDLRKLTVEPGESPHLWRVVIGGVTYANRVYAPVGAEKRQIIRFARGCMRLEGRLVEKRDRKLSALIRREERAFARAQEIHVQSALQAEKVRKEFQNLQDAGESLLWERCFDAQ